MIIAVNMIHVSTKRQHILLISCWFISNPHCITQKNIIDVMTKETHKTMSLLKSSSSVLMHLHMLVYVTKKLNNIKDTTKTQTKASNNMYI